MIVEMHSHTSEHSRCSQVSAAELIRRACDMGIQVIVLTDHHYQWTQEGLDDLRGGFPEIFHVLAGQEVNTSDFGHVLVYGSDETIEEQQATLCDIRAEYPDAAFVWAHPYRDGNIPAPEQLCSPLVDAVEIFTSNHTISEMMKAVSDWHKFRFVATAGTDTHVRSYTGTYPTIFDHPFDSIKGLAAELKAGRCRPYFKEVPRMGTSPTAIQEITIGPKAAPTRKQMVVKTFDKRETWLAGKRTHDIADQLCRHGFAKGPYRVAKPLDADTHTLCLVEERITGKPLFDVLVQANRSAARRYLEKAALWLTRLHNARLELTPKEEFVHTEPDRLNHYLAPFVEMGHRHVERIRQIREHVLKKEEELVRPDQLVQGHGDYHPKNILIGREGPDRPEYVAAIDFHSSCQLPRAFDVGTFLAQYANMFFDNDEVRQKAPPIIFLETYLAHAESLDDTFNVQLDLFKARTCLSILYYLNKVGKGVGENFWKILVQAEKSLASTEIRPR